MEIEILKNYFKEHPSELSNLIYKNIDHPNFEKLLLENLEYIMEHINISELSENEQLAAKKDHVMWCPVCEDLIESIICYEKCTSRTTFELEYGFDDNKVALYDNEDEEIVEKENESMTIYCEGCDQELNDLQYKFINDLVEENDLYS